MKKKKYLSLFILPFLAACQSEPKSELFHYTGYNIFDSVVDVKYEGLEDITAEIEEFLERFTIEANPYTKSDTYNNVGVINATNDPVVVSDDLYALIKTSWEIKEETEGYFNPLISDLTLLWKKTLFGGLVADRDYIPTEEKINEAKAAAPALLEEMKNSSLVFDDANKTVQRLGNAKLDLGGVTKGYAAQKVAEMLKEADVDTYLVNCGVSSLGIGLANGGNAWRIRLSYTGDEIIRYYLSNTYSANSAVYEQYRIVNGVTYSHVINTLTGYPETDYSMAFLAGADSTRLDAYATACMIAGVEKTKEWEKAHNFNAAIFEDEDGVASLVYENENFVRAE